MAGPSLQAPSYTYCVEADVQALLSVDGEQMRLTDAGEDYPTATEAAYLTTQGINWASSRINMYCLTRYDASQLATSYLVNEWATIFAARWLCSRRGNPVPKAIQDLYDEALEDLKQVRMGQLDIPDIGQRDPGYPAWSNMTVRPEYLYRKVRREQSISDTSPTTGRTVVDLPSQFLIEP